MHTSVSLAALVLLTGCVASKAEQPRDFRGAKALRVLYTVADEVQVLDLGAGDKRLQSLLDAIGVTGTDKGLHPGLAAPGRIEFIFGDGTLAVAQFVKANQLDLFHWGQVYVKPDFYQKINEILSQQKGRPIDILANNR